jgi:hypothetical protein
MGTVPRRSSFERNHSSSPLCDPGASCSSPSHLRDSRLHLRQRTSVYCPFICKSASKSPHRTNKSVDVPVAGGSIAID